MAKSLKQKVTEALMEALGVDACVQLDDAEHNGIQGLVLSHFFANLSAGERQKHIWSYLDQHLSPAECMRVVFIATDTPDNHEAAQRSADHEVFVSTK